MYVHKTVDICEAPILVPYTKGLQYVLAQNVGHLWNTKLVVYTKGLQYVLAQNVRHLWGTKQKDSNMYYHKMLDICETPNPVVYTKELEYVFNLAQDSGHLWDRSKDHNFRACFTSLILCAM
jgi:hypothetical protein